MKQIRNLGIAALAAFALTAGIGVASASADLSWFVADEYPADIEARSAAPGTVLDFSNWMAVECLEAEANFDQSDIGAEELTTSDVTFAQCHDLSFFERKATVDTHDCQFTFRVGDEQEDGTFDGSVFIESGAGCGEYISVEMYGCYVTIGAQSLPVTYENVGEGSEAELVAHIEATGLQYTLKPTTGSTCTAGTHANGSYDGDWDMKAYDLDENQSGFRAIEMSGPAGIYMAGEGLTADDPIPLKLSGVQDAFHAFTTNHGTWTCATAKEQIRLDGYAMDLPTTVLSLAPIYPGGYSCIVKKGGITFGKGLPSTHGCYWEFDVDQVEPPYTGSAAIVCGGSSEMEFVATSGGVTKCTTTIPAQTGLAGVSFENTGEGVERAVRVKFEISGIEYRQQAGAGLGKCSSGEFEDGTYTGSTLLYGSR